MRTIFVVAAIAASIATTDSRSALSAGASFSIVSQAPGEIAELSFEVTPLGHPVVSEQPIRIDVFLDPAPAGATGRIVLIAPDGSRVEQLSSDDGGSADAGIGLPALDAPIEWTSDFGARWCLGDPECRGRFTIRIEGSDSPGAIRSGFVGVSQFHSTRDPPPGELLLTEVAP